MKTLFSLIAIACLALTVNAQSTFVVKGTTVRNGKTLSAEEVLKQYPGLYSNNDSGYAAVQTIPLDYITIYGDGDCGIIHPSTKANADGTYDMLFTLLYIAKYPGVEEELTDAKNGDYSKYVPSFDHGYVLRIQQVSANDDSNWKFTGSTSW